MSIGIDGLVSASCLNFQSGSTYHRGDLVGSASSSRVDTLPERVDSSISSGSLSVASDSFVGSISGIGSYGSWFRLRSIGSVSEGRLTKPYALGCSCIGLIPHMS